MPLAVLCVCGKQFNVQEDLAGKRVKCPACQQGVTVPGTLVQPLPPAAADKAEPVPTKKRKAEGPQKSNKTMLWLGLGAGVLLLSCCCLGGVGAGAYFLFFAGTKDKALSA